MQMSIIPLSERSRVCQYGNEPVPGVNHRQGGVCNNADNDFHNFSQLGLSRSP